VRSATDEQSSHDKEKLVHDFVAAWNEVMNLGRFDIG